jgi:GNAT superfamily N-acetyltransferase
MSSSPRGEGEWSLRLAGFEFEPTPTRPAGRLQTVGKRKRATEANARTRTRVKGGPRPKATTKHKDAAYRILPLVPSRWSDFERLFGTHGASGGCWCMWWRETAREYNAKKGEANRRAMKSLVRDGRIPGLIAYDGRQPVGWVSVAPREEFPRLATSRVLKPVDDSPVWSVICFFTARSHRGRGVGKCLLRAAVEHARRHGGKVVEGYAVEPASGRTADVFAYQGPAALFRSVGFREVARRSATRPIMRYNIR